MLQHNIHPMYFYSFRFILPHCPCRFHREIIHIICIIIHTNNTLPLQCIPYIRLPSLRAAQSISAIKKPGGKIRPEYCFFFKLNYSACVSSTAGATYGFMYVFHTYDLPSSGPFFDGSVTFSIDVTVLTPSAVV